MIRCVKRGKSGPAKHPKAGYGEAHPMVSSCWAQRTEQVPRREAASSIPSSLLEEFTCQFCSSQCNVYFKKAVPFTASRTHVTIHFKRISLHFQLSHTVDGVDALLFVCGR